MSLFKLQYALRSVPLNDSRLVELFLNRFVYQSSVESPTSCLLVSMLAYFY